jgi:uncharacterized repeat protein (TIGR03803 family)
LRKFRKLAYAAAQIDRLESRTLLTGYLPSTVAAFATANGATPDGGLVADSAGNLYGTTSAGGSAGDGCVFEIPVGTTTIVNVASFTGGNGAAPMGTLYLDSSGTLWGTTSLGGANNSGAIFKIVSGSGTITTVASFNSFGPNHPTGNLVADSAGDLFGTDSQGGVYGAGGIFELAANSNVITTVATDSTSNGAPQPDLAIDSSGNLYGTTATGGSGGDGLVFEVVKNSGKISTVIAFSNGQFSVTPGYLPSGGLVVDAQGNLFGELYAQSPSLGSGSLFEIQGGSLNELAYFSSSTGVHPSGGLVVDSAGDLFGTTTTGAFEYTHSTLTSTGTFVNGTPHGRLLIDSAGDLIGDSATGGAGNVGLVYKLTPSLSCSISSPTTVTAGVKFGTSLQVSLLDPSGHVMNTSSATVTLSGNSLMGTTSVAAVKGVAVFNACYLTAAGTVTLTASATGFVPAVSPSVTVIAAAPAKLVFAYPVPNAVAGQPIGGMNPLTIRLVDAYGNIITGVSQYASQYDSISLALANSVGISALSGTTTIAMNGGSSITFTGVTAAIAGSGDTLVATDTTSTSIASATSSVFTIVPQAFQFSTVYTFDGTGGIYPNGPLLFDSAGKLYGTTGHGNASGGGFSGAGTAYTIPAAGPIAPVYDNGIANGAFGNATNPVGGLIADRAGNLYGAGSSSIFEIPARSTTPVTIAVFTAPAGYFYTPDGPLAVDSAGDVFGASYNGGDYHQGDIFEVPSGGTLTTIHSFNDSDGFEPEGGVVIDSSGNLFGTTISSTGNGGIIFEIPAGTSNVVMVAHGPAFTSGLTIDSEGNLFGTDLTGSSTYGIFELVKGSSTITNLATFDGNDGTVPTSPPVLDSAGDLFGTTTAGGTAGQGTFYELPHGQPTPIAYYNFPSPASGSSGYLSAGASLAFDSNGNLWGVTQQGGAAADGTLFEISKNSSLTLRGTTYLRMDADHVRVDVYNNSTGTGTPSQQVPLVSLSTINASSVNPTDTLTIDCSAGVPLPSGGVNDAQTSRLTLIGTTGSDSVVAVPGSVTINGITITQNGPVTFVPDGGSDSLNVSTGSFKLAAPFMSSGTSEGFSSLIVGAAGLVDASALLASGKPDVLTVGTIAIAGRLNLGTNAMDISGSSLSTVDSLLQSAYDNGLWDGNGIFSSNAATNSAHLTSLAVIQNNQGGQPLFNTSSLFHGLSPAPSDVLIGYTYYGDANLDGRIDGSDYSRIDAGFLSGAAMNGWFNGDFDYNGAVDGSDYTLIDNAFNMQGASLNASIASPDASMATKVDSVGAVRSRPAELLTGRPWKGAASSRRTATAIPAIFSVEILVSVACSMSQSTESSLQEKDAIDRLN